MNKILTTVIIAVALGLPTASVYAKCPDETGAVTVAATPVVAKKTWHWDSNPEAYQPDEICIDCQDYRTATDQAAVAARDATKR
jgi:hypothetical protein